MQGWKNRFNPQGNFLRDVKLKREQEKLRKFHEEAKTSGIIVACHSCKKPLWNIKIDIDNDPSGKTRHVASFEGVPPHHEMWDSRLNSYDPEKPCPFCGKSFMKAIPVTKDNDGKVMMVHKPYCLGHED